MRRTDSKREIFYRDLLRIHQQVMRIEWCPFRRDRFPNHDDRIIEQNKRRYGSCRRDVLEFDNEDE